MAAFRFRKFPVYQDARCFRKTVRQILRKFDRRVHYALIDQIDRACLSIVLNIAEGSTKKSDADFARFLEHAIGSANEVVAGFDAAHDDNLITSDDLKLIEQEAEKVVNQLGGFIKTLRKK